MSYINSYIQNDQFSRFISVSVGVHIALVLMFSVKAAFFPEEDILIQSAIRVDVVDIPDKVVPTKPKAAPKKPPVVPKKAKPEKPKKKPENLKKLKNAQEDAMAKLKANAAMDEIMKEMENKEKEAQTKPVEYKGNVKTPGDSLKGLDKLEYDDYYSKVKQHVHSHWNLPQWLANANLKVQIVVYLDQRGNVVRKELKVSSQNTIFDETALGAIEMASPFPRPPDRLKSKIDVIGFVFSFPQG